MALHDQRRMLLADPNAGPADVQRAWTWLTLSPTFQGFPNRGYATTWIDADEALVAFVSEGRWVASCPHCNGGVALWPGTSHGGACYDCGRRFGNVDYPTEAEVAQAELLLGDRPVVNQNWLRAAGEPLTNLVAENELMALAIDPQAPVPPIEPPALEEL